MSVSVASPASKQGADAGERPVTVCARIEDGSISFILNDRPWLLHRPMDLESLWEDISDEEFNEDERLPYWVELWPASLALALWLEERKQDISGRTCLDLGCGLGFTAIVGMSCGARVLGLDYEEQALAYARRNADANGLPSPVWAVMDWRRPAVARKSFDCIWGGDILYESRFARPVYDFLDHALAPDGVFWIAEPGRGTYEHFMKLALDRGWRGLCVRKQKVEALHVQKHPVSINIWELRRA